MNSIYSFFMVLILIFFALLAWVEYMLKRIFNKSTKKRDSILKKMFDDED